MCLQNNVVWRHDWPENWKYQSSFYFIVKVDKYWKNDLKDTKIFCSVSSNEFAFLNSTKDENEFLILETLKNNDIFFSTFYYMIVQVFCNSSEENKLNQNISQSYLNFFFFKKNMFSLQSTACNFI